MAASATKSACCAGTSLAAIGRTPRMRQRPGGTFSKVSRSIGAGISRNSCWHRASYRCAVLRPK